MRTRPLEELLAKVPSRYALANVVADRGRQLIAGDLPAIETTMRNPVLIAMEELALGKLHLGSQKTAGAPKKGRELFAAVEPADDASVEHTKSLAGAPS